MDFDAFISYSRHNYADVLNFKKNLEREIPGIRIWFDLEGIESGDRFINKIVAAIDKSKSLIFVATKESLNSEWAQNEVLYAEQQGKRIYPILLYGDQPSGWFSFKFSNIDCIDWTDNVQKRKFLDNLAIKNSRCVESASVNTIKDSQIFMLGFYMASMTVGGNFKQEFDELSKKVGLTINPELIEDASSAVAEKFNDKLTKIFEFGQLYFIASYIRMMMVMGASDVRDQLGLIDGQLRDMARRICLPEWVMEHYYSITDKDILASYVKVMQAQIDNIYQQISKCKFCGSEISSDSSVCYNCKSTL